MKANSLVPYEAKEYLWKRKTIGGKEYFPHSAVL